MPHPLLISNQLDYLIHLFFFFLYRNSHIYWQTVQNPDQLAFQKPTDLDIHCLLRQCMSWSAREELMSLDEPFVYNIACVTTETQISRHIRTSWSDSLLSAWGRIRSFVTHRGFCKDWSDCADSQADLNLCWLHMQYYRKCLPRLKWYRYYFEQSA